MDDDYNDYNDYDCDKNESAEINDDEEKNGNTEIKENTEASDNPENIKKCIIVGQANRYQIKKLTTERKTAPKKRERMNKLDLKQEYFTYEKQLSLLESNDEREIFAILLKEIEKKISGYKQQDIEKQLWDEEKFITLEEILKTVRERKIICHYCCHKMFLFYENVREPMQWTVDRIDNDLGHNKDNYVLACLKCNLARRRTNKDKFLFTKQLTIVRV